MAGHEKMAELLDGKLQIINLRQYSCTAQGIKVWLAVSRKTQFTSQYKNQVPYESNVYCHCIIKYLAGVLFVRETMILE
jgi:hypothetical protein